LPGCPDSCLFQFGFLLRRTGCPVPAEFVRTGDEVSSCPDPSVHRPCQRWCLGFPRCIHSSALLGSIHQVSLSPLASSCADDVSRASPFRVSWLYRRSSCGQTRRCDHSAIPASPRRVSPALLGLARRRCVPEHPRVPHPPVLAGDRSSSLPEARLLQRLRLLSSGCPRNSSATRSASDVSPGIPEYYIFRLCRWGSSGSPRTFLSTGVAEWWISGFPRISRLPAVPYPVPRVAPSLRLRLGR